MPHSRPCHPMLFTVLPVLQTKASSLSAGTELGAAATAVSSLQRRAKLLNNTDLLGNTDVIFFHDAPSLCRPSLPALCPLLGLQFLSWVCFTLPWQQMLREAASALSLSLILVCFSRSFTLSKDFHLSLYHSICVFFLCFVRWMLEKQMVLCMRKKVEV